MNRDVEDSGRPVLQMIMPVGSDPDHKAKQQAIARGAEAAGLHPRFPEYQLDNPLFSKDDFARQLRSCALVLADVTGERPSCYFEIGFAEALGLQVILIAQEGTDIHQSGFRHLSRTYRDFADLEAVVTALLSTGREFRRAAVG